MSSPRRPTIWVLGDQLNRELGALHGATPDSHRVLMIESRAKLSGKRWHRQRVHFVVASMRRFADELREAGFEVDYRRADSLRSGHADHVAEFAPTDVTATEPASWDGLALLRDLDVTIVRSNQFLCHYDEFAEWASGRKQLKMEDFYRWQRRRLGYLMDGDEPVTGRWNYDDENRQRPPKNESPWPVPPRSHGSTTSIARCSPTSHPTAGAPNPTAPGRRHDVRRWTSSPLRRRGAADVRAARGRHGRTIVASRPFGSVAVPERRPAAAGRGVRCGPGRIRRGPGPDRVGRRVHPTGDRLARVRVGRLLALDARLPRPQRARRRPPGATGVPR